MKDINPDRARSRLQQMTNTQLWKFADKHHIGQAEHGRKLTRKRLIARLMLEDSVICELGAKEGEAHA
ncbi:MAG: hypothetical protein IJ087_00090 [Eggerthellaceae bacterium]|nr:hypothetical protein [Eggerthellaceae bacterium]